MRKTFLVVVSLLLVLLSGQGCPTTLFGPESPRDRAWRICTDEMGMSNDSFDSLYSVVELDHSHGFSKWEEMQSAFGGCDDGCSGYNWCLTACHDCSVAVVDAVYDVSPTAKTTGGEGNPSAEPAADGQMRQSAADQIGN
ncbi:MAG: hypothetical protein HYT48_01890 [Candidatus Vogelbacteria bacterium]|nr:hypothetical protein [Candidatus Vogelbacteria bacterium]